MKYYTAEKVPDNFFVLRGEVLKFKAQFPYWYVKEINATNSQVLETEITLAELPVTGSVWLTPLRDEISYGNIIIGVGLDNALYESHTTAEGVMSSLIPEETISTIKLSGLIWKIAKYLYRLILFTDKEIVVVDPEKDYQILNRFDVGLYDPVALTETPYGVVFVGSNGEVYLTDGVRIESISTTIKHVFKAYYSIVNSVVYSHSNNEVLILCGRNCFVYHFPTQRWSVYAFKGIKRMYAFDNIYLISVDGKIYQLNYSQRSNNGEKVILATYKNNLGVDGEKKLNYIEFIARGDDYSVVVKTDMGTTVFNLKNKNGQLVRLPLKNRYFNWIQLVFYSKEGVFIDKISLDFEPTSINLQKTLLYPDSSGIVLTAFNEHSLSLKKPNVKSYSSFNNYPDNPIPREYSYGCVYEEVFKDRRWNTARVTDFNYNLNMIKGFFPNLKAVAVLVNAFWLSINSVGGNEDEDFSETSRLYYSPIRPDNMPYIIPALSMKSYTFGRGGLTGQWTIYNPSLNIYKLNFPVWNCLWVYYNGTNRARYVNGAWDDFLRFNDYTSMTVSSKAGWYHNPSTGELFIKMYPDVHPDWENISVVEAHQLDWKVSDSAGFWDFDASFNPLKHFRMLHPLVAGTPTDEDVVNAVKLLKEQGFTVLFYPFLSVLTAFGHGWRGHISHFNTNLAIDYTNWILHYAMVFKDAGVYPDIFILGSEMKKLETFTGFADLIVNLSNSVKSLLPGVKTTYAMDWGSIEEILSGDTSRNYFESVVWNAVDYLGIDIYRPFLNVGEPYTYDVHKLIQRIATFIESWYLRHPKPVIVTEYGISSVDKSLYAPYIFPPYLPPGSDGSVDELSQLVGYLAFHYNFAKLKQKGIVKLWTFYNWDARVFPAYPDARVWNGWSGFMEYYADWFQYDTNHNIINKLTIYGI